MSITMRIIQQFDPAKEKQFLELEEKFAQMEASRPDFPKRKRMVPVSACEPCNTLIWQHEFSDIAAAYDMLQFFSGDESHETLFEEQSPFIKQVKIEFYKNPDF